MVQEMAMKMRMAIKEEDEGRRERKKMEVGTILELS